MALDTSQGSSRTRNPGLDAAIPLGLAELQTAIPFVMGRAPCCDAVGIGECDGIGQTGPPNPKGIESFSPGLPLSRLPWVPVAAELGQP